MPDFQGTDIIKLKPNTADMPYAFSFPPCSSATANDGAIPFGSTVGSCTVKAYAVSTGADVTTQIVAGSTSVVSNVVTVELTYPATAGPGLYKLTFQITLNTGATEEFDFPAVEAINAYHE